MALTLFCTGIDNTYRQLDMTYNERVFTKASHIGNDYMASACLAPSVNMSKFSLIYIESSTWKNFIRRLIQQHVRLANKEPRQEDHEFTTVFTVVI